jgi:hypothetical protein
MRFTKMVKARPLLRSVARCQVETEQGWADREFDVHDCRDFLAPAARRKLLRKHMLCAQQQADCRTRDSYREAALTKNAEMN